MQNRKRDTDLLNSHLDSVGEGEGGMFQENSIKSINSSVLSLLYGPSVTSRHDYWKNHSFDYTEFCWQIDISAF